MGIGPWRRGGGRRRSWLDDDDPPYRQSKPAKRTATRKTSPIPHPKPPLPTTPARKILLIGGSLDSTNRYLNKTQKEQLIHMFSAQEWEPIWCGMSSGLAGELVSDILHMGCKATAILVRDNKPPNIPKLAKRKYVDNFHERSQELFSTSDAALILPGGLGTIQELTQLIAWRSAELYDKPIVVFDPNDHFAAIRQHYQQIQMNNAGSDYRKLVVFIKTLDDLPKNFGNTVQTLKRHHIEKWHLFVNTSSSNKSIAQDFLRQISNDISLIHIQNTYPQVQNSSHQDLLEGKWWSSHTIRPENRNFTFSDELLIENILLFVISQSTGRDSKKWTSINQTYESIKDEYKLSLPPIPNPKNVHSELENIALLRFVFMLLSPPAHASPYNNYINYRASTQHKVMDIFMRLVSAANIEAKGFLTLKFIMFHENLQEYFRQPMLTALLMWIRNHPQKNIPSLHNSTSKLLQHFEGFEQDFQKGLNSFQEDWQNDINSRKDNNNLFLYYTLLSFPDLTVARQVLLWTPAPLSSINANQVRSKIQRWQPTEEQIVTARKMIHTNIDWIGN